MLAGSATGRRRSRSAPKLYYSIFYYNITSYNKVLVGSEAVRLSPMPKDYTLPLFVFVWFCSFLIVFVMLHDDLLLFTFG